VPSGGRGFVFQQPANPRLKEVKLLFANRSEKDIPFRDELDELAQRIPQLRIVHVLSRPDESWPGYRGHIDEELLAQEISGPESRRYYLSGPPSLGESMRRLLVGRGVDQGSIIMEQFLGYE
jgi:ferredoxin-NADP reductase